MQPRQISPLKENTREFESRLKQFLQYFIIFKALID
jgi:hypothetical protein